MSFVSWFAVIKTHSLRVWGLANIIVQLVQVGLLTIMNVRETGNVWYYWITPFILFGMMVAWWFDRKHLIAAESSYSFKQTPEFLEMRNDLKEIKEALKK